jgi:hypothetical protein
LSVPFSDGLSDFKALPPLNSDKKMGLALKTAIGISIDKGTAKPKNTELQNKQNKTRLI